MITIGKRNLVIYLERYLELPICNALINSISVKMPATIKKNTWFGSISETIVAHDAPVRRQETP